jgi:hypothetical protein
MEFSEGPNPKGTPTFTVKLTYFKTSGKFYSNAKYKTTKWHLHEIFEEVAELKLAAKLPGLVEGHSDFIVLCRVPKHPHNHPALFVS